MREDNVRVKKTAVFLTNDIKIVLFIYTEPRLTKHA